MKLKEKPIKAVSKYFLIKELPFNNESDNRNS